MGKICITKILGYIGFFLFKKVVNELLNLGSITTFTCMQEIFRVELLCHITVFRQKMGRRLRSCKSMWLMVVMVVVVVVVMMVEPATTEYSKFDVRQDYGFGCPQYGEEN